ncbi:MAG: UDP-4-amino-4,6-dideoxy-N-acetyl-beta-L-altrosamine N-acetyltransferase [Paraglaciecola sp.]
MSVTPSSQQFIPFTAEYLTLVWHWRNSARVRANMHYDKLITWHEHQVWFDALQADPSRQYWIYCQHQRPIGVLNFSDINTDIVQWGCYLSETDVLPGSGLVLEWAALEYVSTLKSCTALEAQVLSFNLPAIKLHTLFGYEALKTEKGGLRQLPDGDDLVPYDVLHFRYLSATWRDNRLKVLSRLPKPIQNVMQHIQFLAKDNL